METNNEPVVGTALIDCPVCSSGNRFQLRNLRFGVTCDDCGFLLAEALDPKGVEFERCVFCEGNWFYDESPLSLSLLGKSSVCYVCEAKYKGARIHSPDEKYRSEVQFEVQKSMAVRKWRERVEQYNQE